MITIKFIPPGEMYSARRLKVKSDKDLNISLSSETEYTIENADFNELDFKLDYHKANWQNNTMPNGNKYLLVYLKFRRFFPLNYIDLMFKSSLATKEVSKEQFLNNDYAFLYKNQEVLIDKRSNFFRIYLLGVVSLCALQITNLLAKNNIGELVFWFGSVATIIGISYLYFFKKDLIQSKLLIRLIAFLLYSIVFFIKVDFLEKWILYLYSIIFLLLVFKLTKTLIRKY